MPVTSQQHHSPESIRKIVGRFREYLGDFERIAQVLEDHEIATVPIEYQASLECALRDFGRWRRAADDAVNAALSEYFRAVPAGSDSPKSGTETRRKTPKKRARRKPATDTQPPE